ncbi:hypothetical protein M0R45_017133 [Rubus argutus]|uniref:Secreted protein n=1 Tax=Rubus argutus TaxID=59490 RepID=A0AAW1XY52_RUBAR
MAAFPSECLASTVRMASASFLLPPLSTFSQQCNKWRNGSPSPDSNFAFIHNRKAEKGCRCIFPRFHATVLEQMNNTRNPPQEMMLPMSFSHIKRLRSSVTACSCVRESERDCTSFSNSHPTICTTLGKKEDFTRSRQTFGLQGLLMSVCKGGFQS